MRRGTRVGQAYVAVTADGSGINEEIVESVDEAGDGVGKAGKEHGREYGSEFGEALDASLNRFADRLGQEFSNRMAAHSDDFGDRFEKSMRKTSKRISKTLGESIRDSMDDSLGAVGRMIDLLEDRLVSVSRNANGGGGSGSGGGTTAGNQQPGKQTLYKSFDFATMFEAARLKLHRDANEAIAKDDLALAKSQKKIYDSVMKMEESRAAFVAKFENAREKMREQSNAAIFKDDQKLFADQKKLHDSLAKEAIKRDAEVWTVRRATAAAHQKYLNDLARGKTDQFGAALAARRGSDTDMGDRIGGLLGAGSRNNALNLFGKSIGGAITGVASLQRAGSEMFATFQKGWTEAGQGASLFQKLAAGGGAAGSRAMASLTAAGPAAAASIFVVVGALSVMASVASALTAILTALASTIVSALAGGFLVLGGAMAAAVAAAGLLTVAFTSMTDAQSKLLTDAFQPLKAELTGIGQLMITQMIPYFDTWSTNLQEALFLAAPAAQAMGAAFGQAGAALTNALSGPGFQAFATALAVWLPSIVLRMSNALGSFLNGLTGVFAALLPSVNRFAGYLESVAARFSEWANSAQGQNAIVDFTDRALVSLQSLWNFVREFSGFLADVLFSPEAQNFGNGMFDGLADSFARLRKRIDSGDLERWFKEAAQFGEALWQVMVALGNAFAALNNAGVLEATGVGLSMMAGSVEALSMVLGPLIDLVGFQLSNALVAFVDPMQAATNTILGMGDAINAVLDAASKIPRIGNLIPDGRIPSGSVGTYNPLDHLSGTAGNGLGVLAANRNPTRPDPFAGLNIDSLISSGNSALNATSIDSGGYKKPKEPKKWVNPYVEYAESLIKEGPSAMAKVRKALRDANKMMTEALREGYNDMQEALRDVNKSAANAIRESATAENAESVTSALLSVVENARAQAASASASILSNARSTAASLRSAGKNVVDTAQANLNSAASALAGASTSKAASAALKEVKAAEKALDKAEQASKRIGAKAKRVIEKAKQDAAEMRAGIDAANQILEAQAKSNPLVVQNLLNGNVFAYATATLADFAAAREFVTGELEKANTKLAAAMQIRDDYRAKIEDSIKSFGALTTAQAQVVNGVAQALTANDIVGNLQTRLDKIKAFQSNLRILLASGLSDDAYKQILDMGVEGGTPFVDALLEGGQGAISATNDLTSQIGEVADGLGLEASDRLYQAGVNAAQGLVDGLTSMAAQLDGAAYTLGETIAAAVRRALGIASPSKVLIGDMDYVGDGAVIGLDNQSDKVSRAARRFSENIAVSPEVARYAAEQGTSPVSGNSDAKFVWTGNIITPTEEPQAVVMEVVNEITGRL